jgi:hypothetical protein
MKPGTSADNEVIGLTRIQVFGHRDRGVVIGRGPHSTYDVGATARKVSRRHALIVWDAQAHHYFLCVLGLNGVCIDQEFYFPDEDARTRPQLRPGTLIALPGCPFLFEFMGDTQSPYPTTPILCVSLKHNFEITPLKNQVDTLVLAGSTGHLPEANHNELKSYQIQLEKRFDSVKSEQTIPNIKLEHEAIGREMHSNGSADGNTEAPTGQSDPEPTIEIEPSIDATSKNSKPHNPVILKEKPSRIELYLDDDIPVPISTSCEASPTKLEPENFPDPPQMTLNQETMDNASDHLSDISDPDDLECPSLAPDFASANTPSPQKPLPIPAPKLHSMPLVDVIVESFTFCGRTDLSLPELYEEIKTNQHFYRSHPSPGTWQTHVLQTLQSNRFFVLRPKNKLLKKATQWWYNPELDHDRDRAQKFLEFGSAQPARGCRRHEKVYYFKDTSAKVMKKSRLGEGVTDDEDPEEDLGQPIPSVCYSDPIPSSDATVPATPLLKRRKRMDAQAYGVQLQITEDLESPRSLSKRSLLPRRQLFH